MTEHYAGDERRDGHERRQDYMSIQCDDLRSCWHVDKKVGMSFILALLVYAGGMFWWAGALNNRVQTLESRMVSLEERIEKRTERDDRQYERVISMDSDLKWIKDRLARQLGER